MRRMVNQWCSDAVRLFGHRCPGSDDDCDYDCDDDDQSSRGSRNLMIMRMTIMMTVTHASLNRTWPSHPSWMNYNYNHIHSWQSSPPGPKRCSYGTCKDWSEQAKWAGELRSNQESKWKLCWSPGGEDREHGASLFNEHSSIRLGDGHTDSLLLQRQPWDFLTHTKCPYRSEPLSSFLLLLPFTLISCQFVQLQSANNCLCWSVSNKKQELKR